MPSINRLLPSYNELVSLGFVDALNRIERANPKDVQQIAASQLELLTAYYQAALAQSRRSFSWALIGSGIGLAFFVTAVAMVLWNGIAAGSVPLVSGAIVNVVSSIGFYLYGKSSSQLSAFHSSLDAQQRYLLANSICESLDGEARNTARAALIQEISRGKPVTAVWRLPCPPPRGCHVYFAQRVSFLSCADSPARFSPRPFLPAQMSDHMPDSWWISVPALVVIIFLLWRQQSRRDFYVVQHLTYDLIFQEPAVFRGTGRLPYVAAERGPLWQVYTRSFSDFGAAKTFFELMEVGTDLAGAMEVQNTLYVVRGRKPRSVFFLRPVEQQHVPAFELRARRIIDPEGPDKLATDRKIWVRIQTTPSSDIHAHRAKACEEEARHRAKAAEMDPPAPKSPDLP